MTTDDLIIGLLDAGIDLGLSADGKRITVPQGVLRPEQRALIKAHRAEIIQSLRESKALAEKLMAAAMRACDRFGDDEAARDEMRRDIQATPHKDRKRLLKHLEDTYPPKPNNKMGA